MAPQSSSTASTIHSHTHRTSAHSSKSKPSSSRSSSSTATPLTPQLPPTPTSATSSTTSAPPIPIASSNRSSRGYSHSRDASSRREKAKSAQGYQYPPRRDSNQALGLGVASPGGAAGVGVGAGGGQAGRQVPNVVGARAETQRPGMKSRTLSAPLVTTRGNSGNPSAGAQGVGAAGSKTPAGGSSAEMSEEVYGSSFGSLYSNAQDDIAQDPFFKQFDPANRDLIPEPLSPRSPRTVVQGGLGSAVTAQAGEQGSDRGSGQFSAGTKTPTYQPQAGATMQEINIGVLGAIGAGKSTFIQKAFDVKSHVSTASISRKMSIDGVIYLVQLIEIPFEEVSINEDEQIEWPDVVGRVTLPQIDGTFMLYDVMNKESLDEVPEILNGVINTVPSVLVACKCDNHPALRQVEVAVIEAKAKAHFPGVPMLQSLLDSPASQQNCLSVLLRGIVSKKNAQARSSSSSRQRSSSSAVRHASPKPSTIQKHGRSGSEFSGSMLKAQIEGAYEKKLYSPANEEPIPVSESYEAHQTFLNLESQSSTDETETSEDESSDDGERDEAAEDSKSETPSNEKGYTFDHLIDRLLAQPLSKADNKFADTFLIFFRKFAAPGQLFQSIKRRFDTVDKDPTPHMLKIATQQRYIGILQKWLSLYPGDFACPETKKSIQLFIARLSADRIFAVAAKEMAHDVELVVEDDDTYWACNDRTRDRAKTMDTVQTSSTSSTLADIDLTESISGLTLTNSTDLTADSRSHSFLSQTDAFAKAASYLVPVPRLPISKIEWHKLMETPDEAIARELTRIDFIMFSAIKPRDLVRHVSLSRDERKRYRGLDNVDRMINHFNHLAYWVANFILLRDKAKHRALMLEKLFRVARKVRELNNYNALGAIIAGINGTAVYRLIQTRELVPATWSKDFLKLEILMGTQKSYFAYRLAWENSSGEKIPYLPLHRRDLVSAEEGNGTWMGKGEERINWRKFEIMGDVIVGLERARLGQGLGMGNGERMVPQGDQGVRNLVLDGKLVKDDEELYERSVQLEPVGAQERKRFNWLKAK